MNFYSFFAVFLFLLALTPEKYGCPPLRDSKIISRPHWRS